MLWNEEKNQMLEIDFDSEINFDSEIENIEASLIFLNQSNKFYAKKIKKGLLAEFLHS